MVFISFFKIFFLVVTFGLFHGLIFLPVVLSLIGPVEQVQVQTVTSPSPDEHVQTVVMNDLTDLPKKF